MSGGHHLRGQFSSGAIVRTTWRTHFQEAKQKKILKKMFCLSFSLLYLFILSCKFFIIETHAYEHSKWWERDELINQSKFIIGSGRNRDTRLRHSTWWERDELINQSKFIKGRIHCEIFLSRHFMKKQFQGHFMKYKILSWNTFTLVSNIQKQSFRCVL